MGDGQLVGSWGISGGQRSTDISSPASGGFQSNIHLQAESATSHHLHGQGMIWVSLLPLEWPGSQ